MKNIVRKIGKERQNQKTTRFSNFVVFWYSKKMKMYTTHFKLTVNPQLSEDTVKQYVCYFGDYSQYV
jgi:hypothetical protein